MAICSVILLAMEGSQVINDKPSCPATFNTVRYTISVRRFYVDLVGWCYILLIIVLFVVCTFYHLIRAWKRPRAYLLSKEIIH